MGRARYVITDPAQLEALSSMVRQEVVDTVHSLGACSLHEIASALGRPADGLYHHVRRLLDVGLLVAAGERATARRPEQLVATPTQGPMELRYDPGDADHVDAMTKIAASMLRVTERDFRAAFRPDLATCRGRYRNLRASRQKAWLRKEDVAEANRLFEQLRTLFQRGRATGEGTLHTLTYVMAPVDASDPRRSS